MSPRDCTDCGLPYEPAARNQKRCTPCRVLRDIDYWTGRSNGRPVALDLPLESGSCVLCDEALGLVVGTPVCVACVLTPAGMEEAQQSADNRRQYAGMEPDPRVPARGSSAYEVLMRQVWELPETEEWVADAERALRRLVGPGVPLPRYLVLAAALRGAPTPR